MTMVTMDLWCYALLQGPGIARDKTLVDGEASEVFRGDGKGRAGGWDDDWDPAI